MELISTPPYAVRIELLIEFPHFSFRKSNQLADTRPCRGFAMSEDQTPGNLELHRDPERRFLWKARLKIIFGKQTGKGRNDVWEKALWQKYPKSTGAERPRGLISLLNHGLHAHLVL